MTVPPMHLALLCRGGRGLTQSGDTGLLGDAAKEPLPAVPEFSLMWTTWLKEAKKLAPCSALERLIASVPQSIGTKPQQVF